MPVQSFKAGTWSFEPHSAAKVELAQAAAAEEAAEAAERLQFVDQVNSARLAAAKSRPADVAALQAQWLSGTHGQRVAALLVSQGGSVMNPRLATAGLLGTCKASWLGVIF
jgi:hypothetical protein